MSYTNSTPTGQDQLPHPWIQQWDANQNAWFYVNPSTNPPTVTWERPQGGHNPQQAHSAPAHTDSHSGQNGYGDSAQSGYTAQPAQNTHSTQTNQHGNSQYQHNSQPNTYNQNQHSTSSSGGLLGQLSAGVAMLGGKNNKHGSGYGQGSSHGYGGQGSSTSKLASTAGGALMSAFDMGKKKLAQFQGQGQGQHSQGYNQNQGSHQAYGQNQYGAPAQHQQQNNSYGAPPGVAYGQQPQHGQQTYK